MSKFTQTIAEERGPEVAAAETARAVGVLAQHIRQVLKFTGDVDKCVDKFLDSEFGAYMAQDVLRKIPVGRQLNERPGRFKRHFNQVCARPEVDHAEGP